jgi:hypothetical protein
MMLESWPEDPISTEKSGLEGVPSVIFSANTKKHIFVAKLAKWLLTE